EGESGGRGPGGQSALWVRARNGGDRRVVGAEEVAEWGVEGAAGAAPPTTRRAGRARGGKREEPAPREGRSGEDPPPADRAGEEDGRGSHRQDPSRGSPSSASDRQPRRREGSSLRIQGADPAAQGRRPGGPTRSSHHRRENAAAGDATQIL